MIRSPRLAPALVCLSVLLAACAPRAPDPAAQAMPATPAQAVLHLTAQLRDNDLAGFTRDAVPPALHARLEDAWRDGRTRWPLDELPFGRRLPEMLHALAADDAQPRLQQAFDHQFSGADAQLHGAAASLGLFGQQYVAHAPAYSDGEREHYAQLVTAMARWGARAPLGNRALASAALADLTGGARATGLDAAAFRTAGMDAGLARIGPFAAACKQALRRYGLDLDADLSGLQASLQQQTGDHAQVRMRYRLAGTPVDTVVALQRIDGRWYLADFLRRAEAAAAAPATFAQTEQDPPRR
jgi:hypothetical protein